MEAHYVKADSGNLPKIDVMMVGSFFKNNPDFYSAELKNVKTAFASRESYGDDAVGYVQLYRDSGICTLKCKICPEHRVRATSYSVTMVVDENNSEVTSCECHDCAASAGGCKHAVAFLLWAHRRSEEPACTSVECFWRKPMLSRVGATLKYITVDQLCKKQVLCSQSPRTDLLSEFLQKAKKRKIVNCELLKYQNDFKFSDARQFSLHHFMMQETEENKKDVDKLFQSLQEKLNKENIVSIEESTKKQHESRLWHELRYGRITASKAYEVSRCKTVDGALVASIMGAETPNTSATKRGRILEASVRKLLERKLKKKINLCGLYLSNKCPIIAATPDGICKDAVIEIKCPRSEEAQLNYIKNGEITEKY